MSTTSSPTPSTDSESPYAGLENADTNHATWFDPKDIAIGEQFQDKTNCWCDSKREYFEYLNSLHRGYKNGVRHSNSRYHTYLLNRDFARILSSSLDLTHSERYQVEKWFRRLHFDRLGYDATLSGFCVCIYLVHNDERDERNAHPNCLADWPEEFRSVYDSFSDEQKRRLHKAYGKVQYRISSWSFGEDQPASEEMDKYEATNEYFD